MEDTPIALQDAVAKGQSGYVVIVPEGFGQALMDAAATGGDVPELETVYSYYSLEGNLMDQEVNEYLGVARAYAGLLPDASQADVAAHAGDDDGFVRTRWGPCSWAAGPAKRAALRVLFRIGARTRCSLPSSCASDC